MTRVEWDGLPLEPARLAWVDWFEQLGVNAGDVAIPGWVEVDDEKQEIRYLKVCRDENDKTYLALGGKDVAKEPETVPFPAHGVALPWPGRIERA
jgi:hypothetical protein